MRLPLAQKAAILRNNIFGVDIDPQAVEITMMSLYIKLLEGERGTLAGHKMLPPLRDNIKCGNSLVGHDIPRDDLSDDDLNRINPFDWESKSEGFGAIMAKGGFDAVVGNPPYDVMEKERGESSWPHTALASYAREKSELSAALGGKLNLFRFFIVKALQLTRADGRFGMIVPMAILADISCAKTRLHLFMSTHNLSADCFPQKDNAKRRIFSEAKLSTTILSGEKTRRENKDNAQIHVRVYPWNSFDDNFRQATIDFADLALLDPENLPVPLVDEESWTLCKKIHRGSNIARLGSQEVFGVTRGEINQTIYRSYIKQDAQMSRLLKGAEIARYQVKRELSQGHREWFDERQFLRDYEPKQIVQQTRISTQRITGVDERLRVVATLVNPPTYFADSTNSICLTTGDTQYRLEYLLAFLNSRLFQWRFKLTSTNNNVGTNELEGMPFRLINFSDPADKSAHDRLVTLVERMLALHTQLRAAASDATRQRLTREIHVIDEQIDQQVYALYGLTPDEVAVVEGPHEDIG